MENWKVNLNSVTSNDNYLYEQNDINKALAPNSVFDAQGTQNINSISAESNILNDIEIEDNSIETNSSTETVNTDELIIKQLEAKIEELKSEYEAKQEGKGVVGAVGGFFASCWNGIRGKGFKNNAKVVAVQRLFMLKMRDFT